MYCRDPNWWKELEDDTELEVKYPHEKYGLSGKTSNQAKTALLERFLQFVDANSQPNGRSSDSYGPQFYFISKFTRIVPPKKNDEHYNDVAKRSVISVFNTMQQHDGKDTVGDSTARGVSRCIAQKSQFTHSTLITVTNANRLRKILHEMKPLGSD